MGLYDQSFLFPWVEESEDLICPSLRSEENQDSTGIKVN